MDDANVQLEPVEAAASAEPEREKEN